MKSTRISALFVVVLFMLLAALWLFPVLIDPTGVPFWRSALFSDLLVSHLPNALFLNQSVKLWNQIPLWNPTILSGYPFLADPLAGIWYPPLWSAAVFPLPITFNILYWLHLIWAGVGMWRLAQKEGISDIAALLSGVVFAGAPKWIAHIGLGHISLVSAVSWTPWLLSATAESIKALSLAHGDRFRKLSRAGLLLAVIFLADPRWLLPALVLQLLYALHIFQREVANFRSRLVITIQWAGVAGLFALGGAAGFAAVLVPFVSHSTRTILSGVSSDLFALQWRELSGLMSFSPDQPEKFIYLGVGVTFFALLGIFFEKRRSWFWYVVAVLGLLIPLGTNLPVIGLWLESLPIASLLRVPPRWFYLAGLAAAYFAGEGLDVLLLAPIRGKVHNRSVLIFFIQAACIFLLTTRVGAHSFDLALLLIAPAAVIVLLIWFRRSGWLRPLTFTVASLILISLEFAVVTMLVLETRRIPPQDVENSHALEAVITPYGEGRMFSPSYSVDPLTAVREGVELADGVHPLQLETYWIYMARATGYQQDQYSVTLPPFPTGNPADRWQMDLDLDALSRINIKTIISAYPIQNDGLELMSEDSDQFIYQLEDSRPRAWVELEEDEAHEWRASQITYWSPNRIELIASGPGGLVLSEVAYPGWKVHVDGEPAVGVVVDGVLRGVQLKPGEHRVSFLFRPTGLLPGLAITMLTLLAAIYIQVKR
jgi:hypothetical protein